MSKGQLEEQSDGIFIIKDGKIKPIEAPITGYGKTVISWEAGKPTRAEHQFSEKL